MPRSIGGSSVLSYDETPTGLVYTGTVQGGTPPTTANVYAVGATITDTTSGLVYINAGTSAVPVWTTQVASVTVPLTAANLIAMFTTPVQVLAAVPGLAIVVDSVDFVITRTATAFTGGGVVAVQYGNTANGAGTATHATIAASVVTGAAGTTYTSRVPAVAGQSDIASASINGVGLFISNQTAAFATGTGTAVLNIKYHLV